MSEWNCMYFEATFPQDVMEDQAYRARTKESVGEYSDLEEGPASSYQGDNSLQTSG